MFLGKSDYDIGVNTFSPEGRLFQVEYAIEAIKLGSTGIGIRTNDGVVLAVEKRVNSPLLVPSSIEKIMEIDVHMGCCMSGLTADARTLIDRARIEAQNHRFNFEEPMLIKSCTQAVSDLALKFGEDRNGNEDVMSRPFGVALLIAGVDDYGPALYHCDPSGTFFEFKAKAVGAASEGAQATLQEKYRADLTLDEAQVIALTTLKQVMEDEIQSSNVEIALVDVVTKRFRIFAKDELERLIDIVKKNEAEHAA
eukprot:TRINITY_DN7449_c0_g1_i1.p1 TRINITY_DN7449_c0_g1~~TRINITY_DN7449_c0_g1_i1.p1  ORF type:complete len:285 (+),score=133.93 TRINITY_DN7449_c0_g1_i1:97-855(+)